MFILLEKQNKKTKNRKAMIINFIQIHHFATVEALHC